MQQWDWHDFEDKTVNDEVDEFDQYNFNTGNESDDYITRDFWVGKAIDGYNFTIGFKRIDSIGHLQSVTGTEFQYEGQSIAVPASGGWLVHFNLSDAGLDFDPVQLTFRAKKELLASVACAVYDHYNVTKAGIYCWYAAKPNLLDLYDRALGFNDDGEVKQKLIPHTNKFNRLGGVGRGYAIITKYYR